jgi:cytochrome c oxidase subunit 3
VHASKPGSISCPARRRQEVVPGNRVGAPVYGHRLEKAPVSTAAASPAGSADRRPAILAVGTVIWLASELMFFSGLFAAYFTLRSEATAWPPKGINLDVTTATIATLVLIASSGTMQFGVRAVEADNRMRVVLWLGVTFVLGALFIAIQLVDWSRLNFGIDSSAYGSAFYLMTGFHGLHVIFGLLAMLVVGGRATARSFGVDDLPSVEMLSYYWHFVDVVWIALYATIFLLK